MDFEARAYGKYFLLDKLATGGMAEVFKAKTFGVQGFERLLVIKQILPHLTKDREFVEMFIDEAKISVELSHANIVQVFDLGKIGSNYFIAMEYIDGKDLRVLMKKCHVDKKPLPISHAVYIMIELLKGLEYAHKKRDSKTGKPINIIHRDISPQNIVISYEGEVKVVDFGIAKAERRLNETQAGVLKGKFGYMSPEQATGHDLDSRSDLFACGILLFEMLSARRLFLGENDLETLELIREAQIPALQKYNAEVPPDLEAIVLKALRPDPAERYQDARSMQLELTKFMFQYNPTFGSNDLATFLKSLFVQEIQEEQLRLDHALTLLEEKYKLSDRKDTSGIPGSADEVSFVHPRFSGTQTMRDTGTTEPAVTVKTPTSFPGRSPSGRNVVMQETAQRQVREDGSGINSRKTASGFGATPAPVTTLITLMRPWLMPIGLAVAILLLVYFNFFRSSTSSDPGTAVKESPTANGGAAAVVEGDRGVMEIRSEPNGAEVYVDDRLYGTTPVSLELDGGKDQNFVFKLPGFTDKPMTLYVSKGSNNPLTVTLEKKSLDGASLRLHSSPAGAVIFLNGEDTGKKTPHTFSGLTPGTDVTVRLHKKGYASTDGTLSLIDGMTEKRFKLASQQGVITIQTEPAGANVFINGNPIGRSPAEASLTMDQSYVIVAKLKGYLDLRQEVRVNEDNEKVRLVLKQAIVEYGYVSINADPWAMVYLDGELLGHTPILKSKVGVGEHLLELKHSDFGSRKESIRVTKSHSQLEPLLIIRDLKK